MDAINGIGIPKTANLVGPYYKEAIKNYDVGDTFIYHSVKLRIEEGKSCNNCYFWDKEEKVCVKPNSLSAHCSAYSRVDKTWVYFKKIQK